MTKLGVKVVKDFSGKKQRLKPFEDMFQLAAFYLIVEQGSPRGATILKHPKKESYRIVFGFECGGISPLQSEEQFATCLYQLENGLKDIPKGEYLTVHYGSFANDLERQQELANLKDLEPELQLLVSSERQRTASLTAQGIRKQSFLRFYVTYSVKEGEEDTDDWIEKSLQSIENYWLMFTGQYSQHQQQKLEQILKAAYLQGYQRWQQILSQQLNLGIRPLTDEEEWANLWSRFNQTTPRKIPARIIYDGQKFTEEINSEVHFVSQLMESDSSVPIAGRKTVQVNNQHIGVLLFADKPDGWADEGDQLRFLWEAISKDEVYDTEIFCQLQPGNSRLMREKLRSLTKQSNVAAALASEKNDVDVGAQLKAQKTIEAQAALIEGDIPLNLAIVVLIHRPNERELDLACSSLIASFSRQGWLVREKEYAWRVWCETFPQMTFDKLLSKPFKRRQTYTTSEAPGLLPLCKTPIIHSRGLEFISQEGGNPVYLDLFNHLRHVGLFATNRGGKTLMAVKILENGLAHKIPSTVLEFPKDDGTGAFSDFCAYLEPYCSYLDTGASDIGCNALEPPDLRGFDPKIQQERLGSYEEYLLELLFLLVFAGKEQFSTEIDPERVRTLLILIVSQFYSDLQIINRFAQGFRNGLGTPAWESMPILDDLFGFCSPERLELIDADGATIKALKYIKLRLRGWIETKVGRILNRPTTFATEKLMQVVAVRGLGNGIDAAIIGMVFNLFAARRSLSFSDSLIFADEAPILFEWDSLAKVIGKHFASSAKTGVRVILSAQEPASIGKSAGGDKIFANMTTKIIGKLTSGAIRAYSQWLGYPPGLLKNNEGFKVNKRDRYSQWLLDDEGCYVPVRFYPSDLLLALAANNEREANLRKRYFQQSTDKITGLVDFSKAYLQQESA